MEEQMVSLMFTLYKSYITAKQHSTSSRRLEHKKVFS